MSLKMIRHLLLSATLITSCNVWGCIADPWTVVAQDPERFLERSDYAFFGKLVEFNDYQAGKQTVTFEILETYKGPESKIVTLINLMTNTCSRMFQVKNSTYHVFAQLDETGGNYVIPGYASFTPDSIAIEHEFELGATHNQAKQAGTH